jgi:rhamnogalacturonyl hydrolase YesR
MSDIHRLTITAAAVEAYIQANLFDPVGLMYSGIDSHTNRPFAREFMTPCKVPWRAAFDPWSYWTYEDSVMSMGLYLDGLVLQYEVTGDEECLQRAHRLWTVIERVYSGATWPTPGSLCSSMRTS